MRFEPKSSAFEERVRESFSRQQAMSTMGMDLTLVAPGHVEIEMAHSVVLTQQHGFVHAGVVTTGMDTACGYAAFSLMSDEAEVLTVEFKTNLLRPAKGERFRFVGKVVKAGKTVTVCDGQAYAQTDGREKLVANMSATMMAVVDGS